MIVVRRWYILAVSAISLQSVTWAIISLLRGLLTPGITTPKTAVAFETAVILVGLPIFLVHWLWAQRLADQDEDEQTSTLRTLYLYGMMAGYLAPFAANTFSLLYAVWRELLNAEVPSYIYYPVKTLGDSAIYYPAAMVVLAIFWFYQRHVLQQHTRHYAAETTGQATVRRLYVFAFSAVGLGMIIGAVVSLLSWLLYKIGTPPTYEITTRTLATELTRLLVGLGLWLPFWLWAQRLFRGGQATETGSAMRKFYLYAAVFVGMVTAVASATSILAGLLASALKASFNGDIRETLPPLIVMGIVWAYHAVTLNADARQSTEKPQQAGIRRLYLYLVAGVGLLVLLVGVGGIVSMIFFVLDGEPFVGDVRQGLAWFIAAIIAGLPVWLLPWRQIQAAAVAEGADGQGERQALTRKIYLYLFIFLATMTVLGTAIYIVSQLVELLLDARTTAHLLRDLGMALAYGLMAVGIWLYHGSILRGDGRIAEAEQHSDLTAVRVTLMPGAQPDMMAQLQQALAKKLPDITLQMAGDESSAAEPQAADVNMLIRPVAVGQDDWTTLADSAAYKLLIPMPQPNSVWLGVSHKDVDDLAKQAAQAIEQIAAGKSVHLGTGLGIGAIVALVVGGLILLFTFISLVISLVSELFF